VRATLPPLRGVVHCAGVLADRSLARQDWDSFEQVLAPKAVGAWHLHSLTAADALDFFVLYSSNSALVGLGGQANYAAANAFLDALAHHRAAAGLPALSINWGPWAKVGLAVNAVKAKDRLTIEPEQGLQVFEGLLDTAAGTAQVVVPSTTSAPARNRAEPAAANRPAALSERLAGLAPAERLPVLERFIRECVAAVSGRALDDIAVDRPVIDLGLDSLMTVELRNKLGAALGGKRLPNTFILKYPTVAAMAQELAHAGAEEGAAAGAGDAASRPAGEAALRKSVAVSGATNVVVLSGDPAKVPLVLFHGIGGYAWAYLPLRQYIGDRPVILVNKAAAGETLSEYVAVLVETLRTRQPTGPYIVGGWSAGGRLAYEVAALLESQGEQVLGVLMFDVYRQTNARRSKFAAARRLLDKAPQDVVLKDMHPIERMLTVFGTDISLAGAADVARLAHMVLPHVPVPEEVVRAGMAETARWFLDQLAANGRGLMLPDPSGEITESLETLLTIRRIYRMTMGKVDPGSTIQAPGLSVTVAGNDFSHGWQRHFAAPLREVDVHFPPVEGPQLTPFSHFAEHIAMFDPEHVRSFGALAAQFLDAIDGGRPAPARRDAHGLAEAGDDVGSYEMS
jgi:thioesterase domain-containing protein/acyl carrier protein